MRGVTSISHVAIRAKQFETLFDFYTRVLGFAEMFRLQMDDGSLRLAYIRVTDTQFIELFPNGTEEVPRTRTQVGLNQLCLAVENLDETAADLTARGVRILSRIDAAIDGNRIAWIADPEGNRIELMELSPAGKQAEAIARLNGRGPT